MTRRFAVIPGEGGSGRAGAPELDAVTLARAQRGEEKACRALVVRYQDLVFQVLARVLGQRPPRGLVGVADLAQETFLRVFRQLASFSPAGSARLSTWIFTIATRVAIDEVRRRNPEVGVEDATLARLPAPARTEADIESQAAVAAVERALDRLPPDWRAVLLLRIDQELEYQEIARVLDLELGTVRSRLARARAALWEALAELREGT
jgi:RNA polymerase sigma-70 factor (ECF subfamily)